MHTQRWYRGNVVTALYASWSAAALSDNGESPRRAALRNAADEILRE